MVRLTSPFVLYHCSTELQFQTAIDAHKLDRNVFPAFETLKSHAIRVLDVDDIEPFIEEFQPSLFARIEGLEREPRQKQNELAALRDYGSDQLYDFEESRISDFGTEVDELKQDEVQMGQRIQVVTAKPIAYLLLKQKQFGRQNESATTNRSLDSSFPAQ